MKKEIKKTQKKTIDGKGKAKQVSTHMLVLGILESASIVTTLILHILISQAEPGDQQTLYNSLYTGIVFPLAAAILVQLILIWVKTKAIKEHSKVSPLWTLVGYPVPFGAQIIVALIVVIAYNNKLIFSNAESIILIIISSLAEAFIIVNSFVQFSRIRKTLH